MLVVNTQPFALVYTLINHPHLGYIIEPHVVQINTLGNFSLTHQRVFTKTADYFKKGISTKDLDLIKIMDELDDDFIFKKFNTETKKKIRKADFFNRYCSPEYFEESIRPFIEQRLTTIFNKLRGKTIYKTGNDNNPTSVKLTVSESKASVLFHFRRNEEGTRYFPTIKYGGQRIEFMYKGAAIVCNDPAWMMLDSTLFDFEKDVDGKKLQPFLNKRYIQIPQTAEETYFNKFVIHLVEKYDVFAEGFEIVTHRPEGKALLSIQNLFDETIALKLQFQYNQVTFDYGTPNKVMAWVKKKENSYVFTRVSRNRSFEEEKKHALEQIGVRQFNGSYFTLNEVKPKALFSGLLNEESTNKYEFVEWLNEHHEELEKAGIELRQEQETHKYFIGHREIKLEVKEQKDWFDIKAMVQFGSFSFPFIVLRDYILKGKREFVLPNGMIAIIPNEWFGNLGGILEFSASEEEIKIEKHHIGLLEEIAGQGGKYLLMSDKLQKLRGYGEVKPVELPQQFKGELRPYQKAGFDWFYFLKDNHFGGCLADDMGLGKTIQTLALVQKEKELYLASEKHQKAENVRAVSTTESEHGNLFIPDAIQPAAASDSGGQLSMFNLFHPNVQEPAANECMSTQLAQPEQRNTYIKTNLIVVPNSLVYNWLNEARRFTPRLKVLVYIGISRVKNTRNFLNFDLVITTYGTVRVDIEVLKDFKFNYVILDESQAIKNPASLASRAVRQLKSSNKLVLTGTPIENSVQELWSQISFINPGLLGNLTSFSERFANPIEKGKDIYRMQQLKAIIKPFLLRRTKDQVASELPPKMEQVVYCEMTDEQREAYETVKSHYRNEIIKSLRELGLQRTQFALLQGLTKLRQIANHPGLTLENYANGSGKFDEISERALTAKAEGHKVLIFSQFVKQLTLYSDWLRQQQIPFSYLDGSLSAADRQEAVAEFQSNEQIPFFLISLKAGGLGLNLTRADYVFLTDPWWNPAVERQAVDRTHRIGQDKSVFIYKFITKDTVEEKILALQEKKKELADSIITTEESFIKTIDVDEIMEILS